MNGYKEITCESYSKLVNEHVAFIANFLFQSQTGKFMKRPETSWRNGRDRIVVSTSRCGRENPGSNPGHGRGL